MEVYPQKIEYTLKIHVFDINSLSNILFSKVDEKAVLIRILNRDPKWIDFKKFKEKSTIGNLQSILESLHNKNILKDGISF